MKKLTCHYKYKGSKRYIYFVLALTLMLLSMPAQAEFIADGVNLIPLTDNGKSTAVSCAYHGDLVSFLYSETGTQNQLMVMKSDGSDIKAITPMGNPFFAEWSWKGDKISYEFSNASNRQSQGGIFIYDITTEKTLSISPAYPQGSINYLNGPYWSADDQFVAYTVRPGTSRNNQVFVANAQIGKYQMILSERGQGTEQRWSPSSPPQLCLLTEAGGGGYDVTVYDPLNKELVLLTDTGGRSIRTDSPRWSPTNDWIAFTSDIDMTQSERDIGRTRTTGGIGGRMSFQPPRTDCWISKPDGSESINLTNATSSATEEQLSLDELLWSWDGRWIISEGSRFDNQGNAISTVYLIDPVNGGYEPIITSSPQKSGEIDLISSIKWSYDSTKIAVLASRYVVKNWGSGTQYENPRSVLSIYDIQKKTIEDIIVYDEQTDCTEIEGGYFGLADISWSPDNRSILLTISVIISRDDRISQPDVYRLDLPERLISPIAAQHIGPPIGRNDMAVAAAVELVEPTTTQQPVHNSSHQPQEVENGLVTETLNPMHMTVDEAIQSISPEYSQYFTTNIARNLLLFKGPPDILSALKEDLQLVDTPAPHILVDLLAVELSDEANQELGLDWSYTEDSFGFFQPAGRPIQGSGGAFDDLYTIPGVGQSFYQGVGKLPNEFFIRLNTLVTEGEGTILANPRTVAMSGKESLINIRKTLNYFYDEGFDVSGRPIVRKSDISADTEGRIVPTLLADGTINLVVDIKVGNYTFTPEAGLPELTTRQSTTEVTVQEEQTLVLGGLREQQATTAIRKVPILGDLPLLGNLFRHEETATKNSVLTIFITPHILDNGESPDWPQLDPNNHQIVPIMKN